MPQDCTVSPPNTLSRAGPRSSNLAVERGPCLETAPSILRIRCLALAHAHQTSQSRARTMPQDCTVSPPNTLSRAGPRSSNLAVERGPCLETAPSILRIRCLALAHAHQSSQSSEDHTSRLHRQSSEYAVSHRPTFIKTRSRARTMPQSFTYAVSRWPTLINPRSRARTMPRDCTVNPPNTLSRTGPLIKPRSRARTMPQDCTVNPPNTLSRTDTRSPNLAVERGPCLKTEPSILRIRCLALAHAHQSSQSSEDHASRLHRHSSEYAVSRLPTLIKPRSRARTMPRDCTFNPPEYAVSHWPTLITAPSILRIRCLALAHAHRTSQSSEDHASRLHRRSSEYAVSHWPTLIKARSRAKTIPQDCTVNPPNTLSRTGPRSSKLAVERGPCLETAPSILHIRCLALAHAHQSSQSSEDHASRLHRQSSEYAVSHWPTLIKPRSRARTMPQDCTVNPPNTLSRTGTRSPNLAVERGPCLKTEPSILRIRCLALAHAHQSSQSSEDHASRLHRQSSQYAVSHWPTLIKPRSRARTMPQDSTVNPPNTLSHTGPRSSKPRSRARNHASRPLLTLRCQPRRPKSAHFEIFTPFHVSFSLLQNLNKTHHNFCLPAFDSVQNLSALFKMLTIGLERFFEARTCGAKEVEGDDKLNIGRGLLGGSSSGVWRPCAKSGSRR